MNYEITVNELVVNRISIPLDYYQKSAFVFKERPKRIMNYEITVSELVVNSILILLGYYQKSAVVFNDSKINPRVYSLRGREEAREEALASAR